MRILHLGKYLPPVPGGIETFLGDFLRVGSGLGLTLGALVHDSPRHASATPPFGDSRVYRAASFGQLLYAPVSPGFLWALRAAIRDFRPDVLHIHVPNTSAFFALMLPEARRLPWVLHWHADVDPAGLDGRLRLAYPLYRPLETALLRRATRIVATSEAYLQASRALAPWRDKCVAIPLGIDAERLPPVPAAAREAARALWPKTAGLKVLLVGRLTYYKGVQVLIDALPSCGEVSVVVAGGGGLRATLEAQARQRGVATRIRFLGEVDDALRNALYTAADALCLPSIDRSEAFGLALLEAKHYGTPVLATRIPGSGVAQVAARCPGAVLVEPGDASALAAGLAVLAQQVQHRVDARPLAESADDMRALLVDHWRPLYRQLINTRR